MSGSVIPHPISIKTQDVGWPHLGVIAAPTGVAKRFPTIGLYLPMNADISPKQTLFLWRLLVEPEGVFVKNAKPDLTPKERNQLVQLGLLKLEKRKPTTPRARPVNFAVLSEKGWGWAEKHLDAPLPTRGTAALGVLGLLLKRLKVRVECGDCTLAGLMSPPGESSQAANTEHRLLEACRHLARGQLVGARLRLAQVRAALPEVPRSQIDAVFANWEKKAIAAFYPFEDPRECGAEDENASFSNSLGKPRHLLYFLKV